MMLGNDPFGGLPQFGQSMDNGYQSPFGGTAGPGGLAGPGMFAQDPQKKKQQGFKFNPWMLLSPIGGALLGNGGLSGLGAMMSPLAGLMGAFGHHPFSHPNNDGGM